jgi:hypothetical protein
MIRAAGVAYDIRKAEPYGIYDRFDGFFTYLAYSPIEYGLNSFCHQTTLQTAPTRFSGCTSASTHRPASKQPNPRQPP